MGIYRAFVNFVAYKQSKPFNKAHNMSTSMQTQTSADFIQLEDKHGAHNYHPLPVVLSRGEGVFVWDVEGNKYYDFLSAYSAVNQGHCHPKIVNAMMEQAKTLSLTSRAFYNDALGPYEEFITSYFGFDKVLPMNTGGEAVETAIKITRKWAYEKNGIAENEAIIVVCNGNFHGRTTTIISFSDDANARDNFGPYTGGFISIPYNDTEVLAEVAKQKNVIGFLVEPIQGEAGVYTPDDDFIATAQAICHANGMLFIADEVQTGIARTGSLLAVCGNCSCENKCEQQETYTKPDLLILGKALSGGAYPVSAVLADDDVMNVIRPGQHGSTFGGNPIAARVAIAALEVVAEENLAQNARRLGHLFRKEMNRVIAETDLVVKVRGKGLLNAIIVNDTPESDTAWNLCVAMKDNGLLAKPTHGNIIRFAPPLVMTEEQLLECVAIIEKTIKAYKK